MEASSRASSVFHMIIPTSKKLTIAENSLGKPKSTSQNFRKKEKIAG